MTSYSLHFLFVQCTYQYQSCATDPILICIFIVHYSFDQISKSHHFLKRTVIEEMNPLRLKRLLVKAHFKLIMTLVKYSPELLKDEVSDTTKDDSSNVGRYIINTI